MRPGMSSTDGLATLLANALHPELRRSLRALFVALNDEDVKVRGLAIDVAGRLSVKNPAYVMPQLRRHLMQLLNDMDHSPDSLQREGGHRLGLDIRGW